LLMMNEEDDKVSLILSSSIEKPHTYSYEIYNAYENDKLVMSGSCKSIFNESVVVTKFEEPKDKALYIIKYVDENGKKYINHFHTNIINIDFNKYTSSMKRWGLFK